MKKTTLQVIPNKNPMTVRYAFKMGYDYGKNGPSASNCHYLIFNTKENLVAWEKGIRKAEREKAGQSQLCKSS